MHHKNSYILGVKIVVASVAALVAILIGEHHCAGFMCSPIYLPMSLLAVSVTALATALSLSAFIDVFCPLASFELLPRNIESIGEPTREQMVNTHLDLSWQFGAPDA